MLNKLKQGIRRSREQLAGRLRALLGGGRPIDAATLEEVEEVLLAADVGIDATAQILAELEQRGDVADRAALMGALRERMIAILAPVAQPLAVVPPAGRPFVVLMAGVNGAGKTTTIAKLAHRLGSEGRRVLLAAGDTFRAAAVEQLAAWGARGGLPVVSQAPGADPASVVYDAVNAARARGMDVVIADTAGRLHTQAHLMEELNKIRRVIGKIDPAAPDEVLLVIDATTGQNALTQARQFHEAVGVTGLVVTKLDGTAKGGVVLALAARMAIPIRFIGVGEGLDDLLPFDASEFVDALLAGG